MGKIRQTFLLFFVFESLLAQNSGDTLTSNELLSVIITGTKTERSVATLPIPTQIISGESIKKSGLSRLNEIIQEQTGLVTVPDFGGGEGIQIQGLDAAYVMILIDGQQLLGRSAGTLDLSRVSVNNIDRIEIIKGASSCLYGSEALAGVVNIITKKKVEINKKLKGTLNYKLATFNTHDVANTLEYGKNKIGVELFGNYFKTNGYNLLDNDFLKTVNPYFNYTTQGKIKFKFSEKLNVSVNSRIFYQNQVHKALLDASKYEGKSKIYEWNNSMIVNHTISNNVKLVYDLYATNYKANEYLNNSSNELFDETKFNQTFYRSEIRLQYKIRKNTLTTGVGLNHETLDRTYFEKKASLNSEYILAQFEWYIKKKWNVLTGFRYDNHHQYKSQLSPKMGINYQLNDYFSLKTSIGYGYKAPDLRQLYFDFTNSSVGYTVLGYNVAHEKMILLQNQNQVLNSNGFDFSSQLKPESSVNLNLGSFYKKKNKSFDFNFFYNTIKNLIDTKAIAQKTNGKNVFSYFNIDKIHTYGVELNGGYKLNSKLDITVGYQYLIAKDKKVIHEIENNKVFARDQHTLISFKLKPSEYFGLYNRSKHIANIKVNYLIPKLKIELNARIFYKSKYGIFDSNNNNVLDKYDDFVKGYFLTNVGLSKEFKNSISLQIGVNNVFNYTDKNNITNLMGRQLYTKIQYQF